MQTSTFALLGAAACVAVASAAFAQNRGQTIEVPDGALVLVMPAGVIPAMSAPQQAAFWDEGIAPLPALPPAFAMLRQVDAMMADAQRAFTVDAGQAFDGPGRGVTSIVVTSFSSAQGSCTRQVTYAGDGAAPKVTVRSVGDGCNGGVMPALLPERTQERTQERTPQFQAPSWAMPRTLEAHNRVRHAAPVQVASAQ